jgi:hypothetical protein
MCLHDCVFIAKRLCRAQHAAPLRNLASWLSNEGQRDGWVFWMMGKPSVLQEGG